MTAIAPNKLLTTISFIYFTQIVPEDDIQSSLEAFMAVFEMREIICKFHFSDEVEHSCCFQSCTFLEKNCRSRSSRRSVTG